ncbi:hypothetical protein [Bradyrhizobium elkanii]|uniref:hypothetical protein n=1 Tax=Bradyrhizobium elkanii TaxID=29448 RepID=UPI0004B7EA25|nr:hypothetical protein [Bradyrhizobium elkanii]
MSKVEVIDQADVAFGSDTDPVTIVADFEVEVIQVSEQGPPGPRGNTVLYGSSNPTATIGVDGDFYINTATDFIFGPKAGGWPAGTSLIGQQGPQGPKGDKGDQGPVGPTGAAGNAVRYGSADPTAGVGVDGDFYINTTSHFMFGPKASGAWPAGTSLIGPQGPQGVEGNTGNTGPQGNTGQRGGLWYEGAGAPGTISGQLNNDNYLNTTNGDVYTLTAGSWGSPVGNIRGPQGIQGPVGPVPEAPNDGQQYARQSLAWSVVSPVVPSGTVMLFYQAAAPVGWTKVTTQNDKALRVVSGSGGVAGGTNPFSTVMAQTNVGGHTLTASELPSISTSSSGSAVLYLGANSAFYTPISTTGWAFSGWPAPTGGPEDSPFINSSDGGSRTYISYVSGSISVTGSSSNTGGGSHNHPITMSIQYCDVILASKN